MRNFTYVRLKHRMILILLALLSCPIFGESVKLEKDTYFYVQYKQVKFKSGTSVSLDDSGFVQNGTLAEPVYLKVQGKEVLFTNSDYPKNMTYFHDRDTIMNGVLAEKTVLTAVGQDVTLQAGSSVSFNEDESIFTCSLTNGNYFPIEGKNVELIGGTIFHENGVISSVLAQDLTIQVLGKDVTFYGSISFFGNSKIGDGYIRNEVALNIQGRDVLFQNDTGLWLHENGTVSGGSVAETVLLDVRGKEVLFRKAFMKFHPNENVASGNLAENTFFIIHGKDVEFRSAVSFFKDGSLNSGVLAKDVKLLFKGDKYTPRGVIDVTEGNIVEFDENGELSKMIFTGTAM